MRFFIVTNFLLVTGLFILLVSHQLVSTDDAGFSIGQTVCHQGERGEVVKRYLARTEPRIYDVRFDSAVNTILNSELTDCREQAIDFNDYIEEVKNDNAEK